MFAVAVHGGDHVGREQRWKDPVALHAPGPERVRVRAIGDENRRDDRFGMATLDGRLDVAVEGRVLGGDDRIVRLVDQLDLDARIAQPPRDFGHPLIARDAWQHATVQAGFRDGRDHIDLRRIAHTGAEPSE